MTETTTRTRADELAEMVCALYGWTPAKPRVGMSDVDKAMHQLWSEWVKERGNYTPRDYPELSRARIRELAAERDAIVERTMGRIAEQSR